MARCETLKERTCDTVSATKPRAVVVTQMTITTLAGVCHFDAEQCLVIYCNIVVCIEAVPSPFARSPSTMYPLPPFGTSRPHLQRHPGLT